MATKRSSVTSLVGALSAQDYMYSKVPSGISTSPTSSKSTDVAAKYTLLGLGFKWDVAKGIPMTRLNIEGREVYGASAVTILPLEYINIVDTKLGMKHPFYPQGGDPSRSFTRVLKGDGIRGHHISWALADVNPGTEISVYFAPSEGSLAWNVGPLDPNFDMPRVKDGLLAEDTCAVTQFEINDDTLSHILLMAADPVATFALGTFVMVPHLIMMFLIIWVTVTAPKQMKVALYKDDTCMEWICIVAIYFSIVIKKGFSLIENLTTVKEVLSMARRVHNNNAAANGLRTGAFFALLNILQDPIALFLSLYVAVYLSEDLFLNVLLNVVALEFVSEVDDAMISAFTHWRYSADAVISFSILDLSYATNIDEDIDLWVMNSISSKERVLENLRRDDICNETRWQLLKSKERGLGLLESLEDGREIVASFTPKLGIVDWETQQEDELLKISGICLACTSNETWEHHINIEKRAFLFQHFPELTVSFPWIGSVNLDSCDLSFHHVPYIAQIANTYSEVTVLSCNGSMFGDAGVKMLCDLLVENKSLEHLSLCACGLTDSSALAIAELLRHNAMLKTVWLIGNKGIGDAGALRLAAVLSDGKDANTTAHRIMLGLNSISTGCKENCSHLTDNRMVFLET